MRRCTKCRSFEGDFMVRAMTAIGSVVESLERRALLSADVAENGDGDCDWWVGQPDLDKIPDQVVDEGSTLTFQATAEACGPVWFVLGKGAPEGASIDKLTGIFTWTPTDNQVVDIKVIAQNPSAPTLWYECETFTATVNNVAPSVDAGPDVTMDEATERRFEASKYDPGQDTLTKSWQLFLGDQLVTEGPGRSMIFTPPDDGVYRWVVTVTDDDGGVGQDEAIIFVQNVGPFVYADDDLVMNEGDVVSIMCSSDDVGDDGPHTFAWTVEASNGQVVDEGTSNEFLFAPTDNGTYAVTFRVTDNDGVTASDSLTVEVLNVSPTADAGPDRTADEGSTVSFTVSATDPGAADTVSLSWTVYYGDEEVLTSGVGETVTFTPPDDGWYYVQVKATDDDGGVDYDGAEVAVGNVPPRAAISGTAVGVPGQGRTLTFKSVDAVPDEPYTYVINWGDGSPLQEITAYGKLSLKHTYGAVGDYDVECRTVDKDGATSAVAAHRIAITTVAEEEDGTLAIGGTACHDDIQLTRDKASGGVIVFMNGKRRGVFAADKRILAIGGTGDDSIVVNPGCTIPVKFLGQAGDDHLAGGKGNDELLGGSGHDFLEGFRGHDVLQCGKGRDIQIGGRGSDEMSIGNPDDLVITGYVTELDDAEKAALCRIWQRKQPLGAREKAVGAILRPGITLKQDSYCDTLFGDDAGDCVFSDGVDEKVTE